MVSVIRTLVFALIAACATTAGAQNKTPLPFDVGGAFRLTDHNGQRRTQADPAGQLQMVFFGYVNCPGICGVALPTMADAVDILKADNIDVSPVVITVDPARDTIETMGPALHEIHGDFVGLTGTRRQLNKVYDLFSVDIKLMFEDPEYGDVFAHGSHIYLLDGTGEVLTLLPPILGVDRMTEIVKKYATN
jgi:protein SCO1/2